MTNKGTMIKTVKDRQSSRTTVLRRRQVRLSSARVQGAFIILPHVGTSKLPMLFVALNYTSQGNNR